MVVGVNNGNKLAIECGVDRYDGIERWPKDQYRQSGLERVGWQFWRCFASGFVRNKEEFVANLLLTLTNLGIELIGVYTLPRSIDIEYREVTGVPKSSDSELREHSIARPSGKTYIMILYFSNNLAYNDKSYNIF
jgi:hypothetical protein